MAGEGRAKAPVNFELVEGRRGIHPFYLHMSLDQVIDAAAGWKLKSVERDPDVDTIRLNLTIKKIYGSQRHQRQPYCAILEELLPIILYKYYFCAPGKWKKSGENEED